MRFPNESAEYSRAREALLVEEIELRRQIERVVYSFMFGQRCSRGKGGAIRHFWGGEIIGASADPGQDPRGAPDLTPLWIVLDVTSQGRETDGYPKLNYARPACALLRKCAGSARTFPSQIGTARQRPALNPHLTKSRLNDAPRLCEMHRRNFG
jgi:predicted dithiol-disulfide oxidoreductase (DUF899 family)